MNQENADDQTQSLTNNGTKVVMKDRSKHTPGADRYTAKFYRISREPTPIWYFSRKKFSNSKSKENTDNDKQKEEATYINEIDTKNFNETLGNLIQYNNETIVFHH